MFMQHLAKIRKRSWSCCLNLTTQHHGSLYGVKVLCTLHVKLIHICVLFFLRINKHIHTLVVQFYGLQKPWHLTFWLITRLKEAVVSLRVSLLLPEQTDQKEKKNIWNGYCSIKHCIQLCAFIYSLWSRWPLLCTVFVSKLLGRLKTIKCTAGYFCSDL